MKEFAKEYQLSPSVAEYVVRGYYEKLKSEDQSKVDEWFESHFPGFKRYIDPMNREMILV
jgi:hypothetical protein